jgi:hypothetical protein
MTTPGSPRTRRRQFLRILGAVAAGTGLAGCGDLAGDDSTDPETPSGNDTPERTPTPTHGRETIADNPVGISFDRTVDIVEQYGADPTGEEPVNDALVEAMAEGTLVTFPPGEYRLSGPLRIRHDRVGLVGKGAVRLESPRGYVGPFVQTEKLGVKNAETVDRFLFKSIDVDMRGPGRSGHMHLRCPSAFYVEGVEYVGRGVNTGFAFNTAVKETDGRGVLRDVTVRHGSDPSAYNSGNGRIGVWAGLEHRGTLRIERCDFREFGNNGLYTGRTPGDVQVVDSYFLNNNVASVRISGEGSYVEDSVIEVDFRKYRGPNLAETENAFNARGVFVDGATGYSGVGAFPAGAEVRNCEIRIRHLPPDGNSGGAIHQFGTARSLRVADTSIRVDTHKTPAVARSRPGSVDYRPERPTPPKPHWTKLENIVITGESSDGAAIRLRRADGSVVGNCLIDQPGADRNGIRLIDCEGTLIDGGTIRTALFPIIVEYSDGTNGAGVRFDDPPAVTSLVEGGHQLDGVTAFRRRLSDLTPDQRKWYVSEINGTTIRGLVDGELATE